ncbi:transmembrane protein DUF3566 [Haloactinopolyspora alba]|uniref:Transmembrane protein DUF3566 n=1 Tax=Haloactinopolyspora alba TaxID=648780 RepID=A0A2P8DW11_9ACTN|nr:DUF3566 domain-containing protein [Haloactinopolyspora alba]PSL01406.1 transmembrane protein DUF3566 [Haloactinopolyspora alba]
MTSSGGTGRPASDQDARDTSVSPSDSGANDAPTGGNAKASGPIAAEMAATLRAQDEGRSPDASGNGRPPQPPGSGSGGQRRKNADQSSNGRGQNPQEKQAPDPAVNTRRQAQQAAENEQPRGAAAARAATKAGRTRQDNTPRTAENATPNPWARPPSHDSESGQTESAANAEPQQGQQQPAAPSAPAQPPQPTTQQQDQQQGQQAAAAPDPAQRPAPVPPPSLLAKQRRESGSAAAAPEVSPPTAPPAPTPAPGPAQASPGPGQAAPGPGQGVSGPGQPVAGLAQGAPAAAQEQPPAADTQASMDAVPAVEAASARQARPASARRSGRIRKARLRLLRVDPWSVMKTAFLLSVALGITLFVAVAVLWSVLDAAGVFSSIDEIVTDMTASDNNAGIDINQYVELSRVLGFTTLIAVVDVVLLTALATLGAFLYNLSASLLGGLELTLAEDD